MAYATIDDVEAYWHTLNASEQTRATALLDYAALFVDSKCTVSDALEPAAKYVSCDMVKTAMAAGDGPAVTAFSQTGGPYSANATFANPTGDLYWKSQYNDLLGISGMGAACIRPSTAADRAVT